MKRTSQSDDFEIFEIKFDSAQNENIFTPFDYKFVNIYVDIRVKWLLIKAAWAAWNGLGYEGFDTFTAIIRVVQLIYYINFIIKSNQNSIK